MTSPFFLEFIISLSPVAQPRQFGQRFGKLLVSSCWLIFLAVFFSSFVAIESKASQTTWDSHDPVLISEPRSTRVLAVEANTWGGGLPAVSNASWAPGSRILVFLTNVELLAGERENAFRIYLSVLGGRSHRLMAEKIEPLPKRPWIFALTVRLPETSASIDIPSNSRGSIIRVAWRGNVSNPLRLTPPGTSIQQPDAIVPMPAPSRPPTIARRFATAGDRKRFMEQATFGPTAELDFRLHQIGYSRWLDEQFDMPYPTVPYPSFPQISGIGEIACGGSFGETAEINKCYRDFFWPYTNQNWFFKDALYGEAQLRRRVSWALHQIWVISEQTAYQQRWMQAYIEILDRNAFGNYRDLIRDMTLNPGMGEYLDMVRSTRFNPNENYPRELLQLFTIGLDMLHPDGSLMLDQQGKRIPTYDQAKIDQFTKVFTGWTRCDSGLNANCPNAVVGAPNFIDPMHVAVPDNHDNTAKSLLVYPGVQNTNILPCFFCFDDEIRRAYADESLEIAIDNIFNHPNVGPFVGKALIQHLVTGDPSPAYVERVAASFNNNGRGVRGDMKAVIRAILLDPEARGPRKTDPAFGKFREPVLYLTNFLRTFRVSAASHALGVPKDAPSSCGGRSDGVLAIPLKEAGQDVWYPPNVFSYFSPFTLVPGTDILGPEFGVAHTGSAYARNNLIFQFTINDGIGFDEPTQSQPYPYHPCGTAIDMSEAIAWAANDPTNNALIEGLNSKMMHGTMSEEMKSRLRAAVNFNVSSVVKVRQALYLAATSSQYQIQR
ncbi:MAG TPA: DUF1800 family protein [Pyrinomonadaceae bacterium]|nr:DUF1800 family protein [Pyrinomonadaceae bacterium]